MKKWIYYENIPQHIQETLKWLAETEDYKSVKSVAEHVFQYLPKDDPSSIDFLAFCLQSSKHYKEASYWAIENTKRLPHSAEAFFNAAKATNAAANPFLAERLIQRCLQLKPNWLDARIEEAIFICFQGRVDEAAEKLEKILMQMSPDDPNHSVVEFNLGWHDVRRGDFLKGIQRLRIGRKLKIWGAMANSYSKPLLRGDEDLKGKTVLLSGEGGAGDEIINVRFSKTLCERGAQVIFVSHQGLQSIVGRCDHVKECYTQDDLKNANIRYDYWAPIMDLPAILNINKSEIPDSPYLKAHPEYVNKWKLRIRTQNKLKIGIRWQGNPLYEQDLMRSIPLWMLESLAQNPNVELYSFQRDAGVEELSEFSPVIDWGRKFENWEDTAGALMNMDLIISSCTSIPHLSAALGVPTWVLPPMNSYYIWAEPGEKSPWYSNVRLFRQERFGDWSAAISKVKMELNKLLAKRGQSEAQHGMWL